MHTLWFKKIKNEFHFGVRIRVLKLTLKELKSTAKSKNTNDYKSMSENQLINLIPRTVAFKIEEYIAKLSKRELKDFI